MRLQFSKIFFIWFFCFLFMTSLFIARYFIISAQDDLETQCDLTNVEASETTLSKEAFRSLLEQCKKFYEDKNTQIEKEISKTASDKKTKAQAIAKLQGTIKSLDNQIKQSNLMIKGLTSQISDTQSSIVKTGSQIEHTRGSLSNLLQLRYEEDRKTLAEIFLAEKNLSDFFDNLMALEGLASQIKDFLGDIKNLKTDLETQKTNMDSEKKDLENVVLAQSLQKKESSKKKQQEEYLLQLTEKEYLKYLEEQKDTQDKVSKIGSMLFELLEVPEGGIKLEDAIVIAKEIGKLTGVRPAFSMGILWQETRLGQLKGGCYLKDQKTGDGVYIKSGNKAPKTMKPDRDVPIFLKLISALNSAGFLKTDAFSTPVSCCMIKDGSYFGWGGAMGPAQFIPSTWALYANLIEEKSGQSPANPWNVRDAFLANAIYLKDLGAKSGDYDKEINAALRYFGCTTSWCRTNYGRPVMTVASCFQSYIDKGSMSVDCRDLIF